MGWETLYDIIKLSSGMLPVRVTSWDAVECDDVAVGGGHPVLLGGVTKGPDNVRLRKKELVA